MNARCPKCLAADVLAQTLRLDDRETMLRLEVAMRSIRDMPMKICDGHEAGGSPRMCKHERREPASTLAGAYVCLDCQAVMRPKHV